MIIPWTYSLEWPVFGNLALCGEMRQGDTVKWQAISILTAFYMGLICWALIWYSFIGVVGQEFWTATSYLTWNYDPLLSSVPTGLYYPFMIMIGTKNPWLSGFFVMTASVMIASTNFTIYIVCARMFFAQSFDRLFPSKLAYVDRRTRTPVYAMIVMMAIGCAWVYAIIYHGTTLSSWMGSTQFQISFTQLLTLIGAIVFPYRLKQIYAQSPTKRHRNLLVVSAVAGIVLNVIIMYYLQTVPDLYASMPQSEALIIALFGGSIIYYYLAKLYQRHKGIDLKYVFNEIPPE